jgi:murein endopeptidase
MSISDFACAAGPVCSHRSGQVSAISMVASDGQSVDPMNWTLWQAALLKRAALDPRVDRIFVNPAIKRALCESATTDRAWLQKVRPWWGHDDQFHVRLLCPEGEDACVQTEAVPAGDGCDASLEWWFSAEAKEALQQRAKEPPKTLTLEPSSAVRLLRPNEVGRTAGIGTGVWASPLSDGVKGEARACQRAMSLSTSRPGPG